MRQASNDQADENAQEAPLDTNMPCRPDEWDEYQESPQIADPTAGMLSRMELRLLRLVLVILLRVFVTVFEGLLNAVSIDPYNEEPLGSCLVNSVLADPSNEADSSSSSDWYDLRL